MNHDFDSVNVTLGGNGLEDKHHVLINKSYLLSGNCMLNLALALIAFSKSTSLSLMKHD